MHQHDGLADVPILNGTEPIGFPGGSALDPGPDRLDDRDVGEARDDGLAARAEFACLRGHEPKGRRQPVDLINATRLEIYDVGEKRQEMTRRGVIESSRAADQSCWRAAASIPQDRVAVADEPKGRYGRRGPPQRSLALDRPGVRCGPSSRTSQALSDRSQRPVDRDRAHRQQFATDLGCEVKMTWRSIASTRTGSNAFSRFPQTRSDASRSNMSALFRFIINPRPRSPTCRLSLVAPQQPHRVLAVKAHDDDEFIQNSRLLRSRRSTIALRNRDRQFFPCRPAQVSHSRPCSYPSVGSKLCEAMVEYSGTFSTRQCESHLDLRRAAISERDRNRFFVNAQSDICVSLCHGASPMHEALCEDNSRNPRYPHIVRRVTRSPGEHLV